MKLINLTNLINRGLTVAGMLASSALQTELAFSPRGVCFHYTDPATGETFLYQLLRQRRVHEHPSPEKTQ